MFDTYDYLYYGHLKKQTKLWDFSATELNYPSSWLTGFCIPEVTCCLSTAVHLSILYSHTRASTEQVLDPMYSHTWLELNRSPQSSGQPTDYKFW